MNGIPIVFGWGKKGKVIGYVGIDKCPNCKHYVHFSIYEYSNRVNLYFVPVVKFNKKHYLVCPVCDAAYELTDDLKEYYFSKMYTSMNISDTQDIFTKSLEIINNNCENIFEREDIEFAEKVNLLIETCVIIINKDYHNEEYVEEVVKIALKYLLDDDKPE